MWNPIKIAIICLLLVGCATQPPKMIEPFRGAIIGMVSLVDENPKHVHVGTTVINNHKSISKSAWDIESEFYKAIKEQLDVSMKFIARPIDANEILMTERLKLLSTGWDSFELKEELKPELSELAEKYSLDYLAILTPVYLPVEYNSTVYASGYGLYTRCFMSSCRAYALDHIRVFIFDARPPRLAGWGSGEHKPMVVNDFDRKKELKNLPSKEIDKAKNQVIVNLKRKVAEALSTSGINSN